MSSDIVNELNGFKKSSGPESMEGRWVPRYHERLTTHDEFETTWDPCRVRIDRLFQLPASLIANVGGNGENYTWTSN